MIWGYKPNKLHRVNYLFKNKSISSDRVGSNRRASNSLRIFLTVAICLIKDITSAYSLYKLWSHLYSESLSKWHKAHGLTRMRLIKHWCYRHELHWLWLTSPILHPRFSSCRNEGKLWDYCMHFLCVICNSTVAFSWAFQTSVTKLRTIALTCIFDIW